eukprot:12931266-Prorocentrum_lima.AAC.1
MAPLSDRNLGKNNAPPRYIRHRQWCGGYSPLSLLRRPDRPLIGSGVKATLFGSTCVPPRNP